MSPQIEALENALRKYNSAKNRYAEFTRENHVQGWEQLTPLNAAQRTAHARIYSMARALEQEIRDANKEVISCATRVIEVERKE